VNDKSELLYLGTGRTLIAMDRLSGRRVWVVKLPGWWRGNEIRMLLAHGSELYVACTDGLRCFDRLTGALLWMQDIRPDRLVLLTVVGADTAAQQAAAGDLAAQQARQAAATSTSTSAAAGAAASLAAATMAAGAASASGGGGGGGCG
jgi:hypothetical protein